MTQARDMGEVFQYIARHQADILIELAQFCAQPSVSTEGRGMDEMAEMVRERLEESGFTVALIPLEGGFPVLYAESSDEVAPDAPVLLIYNHYDVQPEGDETLWTSPPFAPQVRDGKFYARGVSDNKGNIIARLAAVDALRAVFGKLPLRIKWVIEGEEEIGSPNLDSFIRRYQAHLAADGCVWEFGTFDWRGRPEIFLGLKGMLAVELRCAGPNRDLHSSLAAYVSSPVWRLVWALNTLKDENEFVAIPGFYDRLRPPSSAELAMVQAIPDDDAERLQDLGLTEFAAGVSGYQRRVAEIFSPTCNIQGLVAGYNGPGAKTILPAAASVKLDLRLVPDQTPDDILILLREHLDDRGFHDIEIVPFEGNLMPARTDPNHPFVTLTREVCTQLAGAPPVVSPSSPASGPMYLFTDVIGVPVVAIGVGYPGSAAHAPDENIRLSDFERGIAQIALLMQRMAEAGAAQLRSFTAAVAPRYTAVAAAAPTNDWATTFTGLPDIDLAAVQAEMAGGMDESRALRATQRDDVQEALEDVERTREIADRLIIADEDAGPKSNAG